jgi:hypothetical protein
MTTIIILVIGAGGSDRALSRPEVEVWNRKFRTCYGSPYRACPGSAQLGGRALTGFLARCAPS